MWPGRGEHILTVNQALLLHHYPCPRKASPMTYRPMLSGVLTLMLGSLIVGCGAHSPAGRTTVEPSGVKGVVHGGQNPVSGATIQLYTVGTTGDGSNSTPILKKTITTLDDGSFDITHAY